MAENFLKDGILNEDDLQKLEKMNKRDIPKVLREAIKTQQGLTVISLEHLKYVLDKIGLKKDENMEGIPTYYSSYKIGKDKDGYYVSNLDYKETEVESDVVQTTTEPQKPVENENEFEDILSDGFLNEKDIIKLEKIKDKRKIPEILKRAIKTQGLTVSSLKDLKYVFNKIGTKNKENLNDIPELTEYKIEDAGKQGYSIIETGKKIEKNLPEIYSGDETEEETDQTKIQPQKTRVEDFILNGNLNEYDIKKLESLGENKRSEIPKKLEEAIKNGGLNVNSLKVIKYVLDKIGLKKEENMQGLQDGVNYKITFEDGGYCISGLENQEETEALIEPNKPASKIENPKTEPKPQPTPKTGKSETQKEDPEVKVFMENRRNEILAEMNPKIYKEKKQNALLGNFHPEYKNTYFGKGIGTEPVKDINRIFIAEAFKNTKFHDEVKDGENKMFVSNVNGKEVLRFYKDGELYLATIVSTGKKDKETPSGNFTLSTTDKYHVSSEYPEASNGRKKGGAVMPYGVYIKDGSLLHGSDLLIDGEGRSHGCIRVPLYYMKEIYEQIQSLKKIKIDTNGI